MKDFRPTLKGNARSIAESQGASDVDYVAKNQRHQTVLTVVNRANGSLTICSDSWWYGEHQQGIAFDMKPTQVKRLLKWLKERA